MPRKPLEDIEQYIVPLDMNGLRGRMLHIPGPRSKQRELLVVYGHHSSLERWWGLAQVLSEYGTVTMPDLPGFGGMDSFYRLDQQPTLDSYADYLASFIKMKYRRKKCTLVGLSFGFLVVTRMLQRHPALAKHVEIVISLVGFAHRDDFIIPKRQYKFYRFSARLLAHKTPAWLFYHLGLNAPVLRRGYKISNNRKMLGVSDEEFERLLAMEVKLWRINDVRTAMYTTKEFLDIDNCQVRVHLPVYHVGMKGDQYFDNNMVEQHMRVVFDDFHLMALVDAASHAPSVVAGKKETLAFIPPDLRRVLRQL